MLKRFLAFLLIPLGLLFSQCGKDLQEEKLLAENKRIEGFLNNYSFNYQYGVYHAVATPGYGYEVAKGDSVAFWFKGYTLDNKVFDTNVLSVAKELKLDTLTRSFDSIVVVAGDGSLIEGLNRGLLLCRGDETSKIVFSSVYGFGDQNFGSIPAWSPLGYDITIIYVINDRIRAEQTLLNQLVKQNKFLKHEMGFWYSTFGSPVSSVNPTLNDTIYGWFRAKTPNGDVFEEVTEQNIEIFLGNHDYTTGFKTGFTLLKPGEYATILVPSPLAYGIDGEGSVDPYTPVIYQMRLDSIK